MASPAHSLSSTPYSISQRSQTSSPWDSRRVPTTPSIPPKGQSMNLDQSVPRTPDVFQQPVQFAPTFVGTAVALSIRPSSGTSSRCYGNDDTFASTSDQLVPSTPYGVEYYRPFSEHHTATSSDISPPILSQSTYLTELGRLANEISSPLYSRENSNHALDAQHRCRPRRRLCLNATCVLSSEEDGINRSPPLVDRQELTNDVLICVDEATVSDERGQKVESSIPFEVVCKSSNEKSTSEDVGNGASSNLRIRNCFSLKAEESDLNDDQVEAGEDPNLQRHTQRCRGSGVVGSEESRVFPMSSRCFSQKGVNQCGREVLPRGYDHEKRLEIERRVHSVQRGYESNVAHKKANGVSTTFLFENDDIFA